MSEKVIISPIRLYPEKDADVIETIEQLTGNGSFQSAAELIKKVLKVYGPTLRSSPLFNVDAAIQAVSGGVQQAIGTTSHVATSPRLQTPSKPLIAPQQESDEPPEWNI